MTGISALIDAFDEAVRTAGRPHSPSVTDTPDATAAGLSEDHADYAGPDWGETVAEAEARVLSFRVTTPADLIAKSEFILREMRKLTAEVEEFDAYANQLRADLADAMEAKDAGQAG